MTESLQQIIEAERAIYLSDPFQFVKNFIGEKTVKKGKNCISQLHRDMIGILESRAVCRKMMLVPREHLKTTVVMGWLIWKALREPDKSTLVVTKTIGLSRGILNQIRTIIESDGFVELFGDVKGETWSRDELFFKRTVMRKEATFGAAGLDTEVTGGHWDRIWFDDIVTWENCKTGERRKEVIDYFKMMMPILTRGDEFDILITGTRYHFLDFYGWVMEQLKDLFFIYVRKVKEEGKLIFPEKFTEHKLYELEREMLKEKFNAQYYNNPVVEGMQKFRPQWFKYYKEKESDFGSCPWLEGTPVDTVISIDPAFGSADPGGDYTGIVVMSMDDQNNLYFRECLRRKYEDDPRGVQAGILDDAFALVDKYQGSCNKVGIEEDRYMKTLQYQAKLMMSESKISFWIVPLKAGRAKNSKNNRIESLQPRFQNGKVYFNYNMEEKENLESEYLDYPNGAHDDLIDAAAGALSLLTQPATEDGVKPYEPENRWTGY